MASFFTFIRKNVKKRNADHQTAAILRSVNYLWLFARRHGHSQVQCAIAFFPKCSIMSYSTYITCFLFVACCISIGFVTRVKDEKCVRRLVSSSWWPSSHRYRRCHARVQNNHGWRQPRTIRTRQFYHASIQLCDHHTTTIPWKHIKENGKVDPPRSGRLKTLCRWRRILSDE